MIRLLRLDQPIFAQFCNYGHFTDPTAPWEQIDCAELLADASDLVAERTL
jgi:S-adenosylmethionine synthetase